MSDIKQRWLAALRDLANQGRQVRGRMDKELKAKWVAALRSGEYKQQTRGALRNADGYCCLGVLADLCGAEWASRAGAPYRCSLRSPEGDYYGAHAGLFSLGEEYALAQMNDRGATFDNIADYIEANL